MPNPPATLRRRALIQAAAAYGAIGSMPAARAQGVWDKLRGQTLRVSYPGPHPHYDAAEQLFGDFTRATGIKIERDRAPYLDMKARQLASMRKPEGDYDVVTYLIAWKTEYVKQGLLRPLDDMLADPRLAMADYDFKDLIPAYVQAIGLVGGPKMYLPGPGARLYGLPYGAETSVLGFRRDILERQKLQVPSTYDELLRACELIRDKEKIAGVASRSQAGHQITHAWLLHLSPFGGQVFDAGFRPALHEDAGVRAAETLARLVETGPVAAGKAGFDEMQAAFLNGECAFYLDTLAVMGPAKDPKRSKVADKVAYAMHPSGTRLSGQTGGFGLAIPKNARHPEAAWVFLQWLTSKANDLRVATLGGNTGRWSTLANVDFKIRNPEQGILPFALRAANPDWRPLIPEWDEMSKDIIGQALPDVLTGRRTARDALVSTVPRLESLLRSGGWIGPPEAAARRTPARELEKRT
ncbi:Maltose-binding periplasmic proteins/domains (plasmid) [Variovorax sp. SRS16]|uniref:ABC transporter substrate-binding protein n=1 Tax=Variovorax sp. SRS16 TaxID=282217 RepID=UPI00131890B4|nr:sugar ABC transporter substrate-binding protein [Variovorax sp. SRS16]VTU46400.1 Maltose-binding periplasmic proteins/domains [Variovorax sp. SRS16]